MATPFYITTPIFYPNANLHLGHAYSSTLVDILARYHRLKGDEVYLLTGADENTEKVVRAAGARGMQVKAYLDDIVTNFKSLFQRLDISYNQFIRTSDTKVHFPGAQEMWRRLVAAGDIEKRSYDGLYCVGHEAFITEKELEGGKCPDHGEVPQRLSEENYFFKLSKYTGAVAEKIRSDEFNIVPETRKNEILALLDRGLEDVSFSRPANKVSVGVPVPGDPSQTIYVWCDALVNYLSALGFGREDDTLFKKFWPADVHVIGKDILRFHAAIWPAMLLSAGLPLPKQLLVHGFITSGGRKMSKTLGNTIDPNELITEYGSEAVRYFLARHISPFEDGDITLESFKEAYNADLANGIGNLVSRVLRMAVNYNAWPDLSKASEYQSDAHMMSGAYLEGFEIQRFMVNLCEYVKFADGKIATQEPFKYFKTNPEKAREVVSDLVKTIFKISFQLEYVMPQTALAIRKLILDKKMPEKSLFPRK